MRIGLFVTSGLLVGGGFQQALSTILSIREAVAGYHEIVVLTNRYNNLKMFAEYGIKGEYLKFPSISRVLADLYANRLVVRHLVDLLNRTFGSELAYRFDKLLKKHQIDIVYFLEPTNLSMLIKQHPYFFTVWDLCHRDWVEFPEGIVNFEFERREALYRRVLPKAVRVIAESDFGRDRIVQLYGVDTHRVIIMPLQPAIGVRRYVEEGIDVDVCRKFGIGGDYIFYPAQLWPHKNHLYILEALRLLRDCYGIELDAVFAGDDKGVKDRLIHAITEWQLDERIHFLGFVDDKIIPQLYRQALALIMPTYFGPTNIPPLEAFALSCPVIYADFPCFRAQAGDGALYCDLKDPRSLAAHLQALCTDPQLAVHLIEAGQRRLNELTHNPASALVSALNDFDYIRQRWSMRASKTVGRQNSSER
jgi:glycosyltransferase involved in cell wall biosynthesis